MGKVQCNHKYPYKREAGGLEEDATLIALKTEEGPWTKEWTQKPLEAEKGKETYSALEFPEERSPAFIYLNFNPLGPILDLGLSDPYLYI